MGRRRLRFAGVVEALLVVAGIVSFGGAVGAWLTGNQADVDRYMPYALSYLALVIAISARWPRPPCEDDREGPPVKGDTS